MLPPADSPRPHHYPARSALLLWSLFSVVFLAMVARLAALKLLWFDELFTWHMARLPGLVDVWDALTTGPDLNPPLYLLAVRASFALTGQNALGLRLPAAIGVLAMALGLYAFVARRCGRAYGWVAALLPLAAGALPYAYEGRAYGLVLGLGALALVSWQTVAEESANPLGRSFGLIGLALSMAAALASHFYAVLLLVPLGLAELARTFFHRRLDVGICLALGSPLLVLVALRPVVANARVYANNFWAKPTLSTVFHSYATFLGDAVPTLVAIAVLGALWWSVLLRRSRTPVDTTPARTSAPPLHELVVAAAFCALPVFAYLLGKLGTGAFTERYALPALLGFGVLLGFGAHCAARGRAAAGVAIALLLFAGFVLNVYRQGRELARTGLGRYNLAERLDLRDRPSWPIIVADPLIYLQAVHYAPPAVADRLVYVVTENSTPERALRGLRRWVPLQLEDYEPFMATHRAFLIYRTTGETLTPHLPNTLIDRLAREKARLDIQSWTSTELVLAYDPDGSLAQRASRVVVDRQDR